MTSKVKSAISTAAIMGVVILLMTVVSAYTFDDVEYRKENPPKIPPEGFEVSLGEPDRGQGDNPAPASRQNAKTSTAATSQMNTPTQSKSTAKVNASEQEVETTTAPENNQEAKKTADDAWSRRKSNKNENNNQGSGLGDTKTPGNQGQSDGNANSLNTNTNGGSGLNGNVKGFKVAYHPKVEFTSRQAINLTVTLDVWVDRNGKVTAVKYRTSTYSDVRLRDKAIELAKGTLFEPLPGNDMGDEPRKGTITVTFRNTP